MWACVSISGPRPPVCEALMPRSLGGGGELHQVVGFLESAPRLRLVVGTHAQRLLLPLLAPLGYEVAAIYVDRAGQLAQRIGHGMDDVLAQRTHIARHQRRRAGGLERPACVLRQSAPEN